ncbi:MAG: T9SS type A sorting domain-containing protein [Saprospiraceae bacterium]|nr:T9SS type A sorting domain-containing protein [Saprospiraceae bacterium]
MKHFRFLLFLLLSLTAWVQSHAQVLICVDQLNVALDANCEATIFAEQILQSPCLCPDGSAVEMDKTAPFGDGPWVAPDLNGDDVGNSYLVRVTDLSSGNACWATITAEDKTGPVVDCSGLTTVNITFTGSVAVPVASLDVTAEDACSDAGQVSITLLNNGASIVYTCTNLGLNTVSLKATDDYGNTSICDATILVADPGNFCLNSSCILSCPTSQSVSYNEGVNVLLPAFLAGDTTVLDTYGEATFDPVCSPSDTLYGAAYQTGTSGFNYFERIWEIQLGGIPFGNCTQIISFPTTREFTFSGRVFVDSVLNCQYDPGETGLAVFEIQAKKLPGNEIVTIYPNADGTYDLNLETGLQDTAVELRILLPLGFIAVCPSVKIMQLDTASLQQTMDFALYSRGICALPQISLGIPIIRRCFSNNFYTVRYSNLGFDTLEDAHLTLELDSLLTVVSAGWAYTNVGNLYTFQVGDLPPFYTNSFVVQVNVDCDAELGQTLCAEALIYPQVDCSNMAWDGPIVDANSSCDGDSIAFVVKNIGTLDMTQSHEFIVVEDIIMRNSGTFQLDAGDSIIIKAPANGSTWRIEAEQVSGYLSYVLPSAVEEGCGGVNTPGLVNAFALSDDPLYHDIDCIVVVGSFDPNDKAAVPTGYSSDNIIRANTDLEYKIRFQNTGTDTAFTVVIVDTLTALLNAFTIEPGAYSHPYRLDVLEYGILRFVFENIMLPDSFVNEPASHGFITFRIKQQPDLPNGTVIENSAAIYFDFNEPVITNTVFHTIGAPYVEVSTNNPFLPDVSVSVRPNPFEDRAVLEISGHDMQDGLLQLYDIRGRLVQSIGFTGNQCRLERGGLPTGNYFFHISDSGSPVSSGKVLVK